MAVIRGNAAGWHEGRLVGVMGCNDCRCGRMCDWLLEYWCDGMRGVNPVSCNGFLMWRVACRIVLCGTALHSYNVLFFYFFSPGYLFWPMVVLDCSVVHWSFSGISFSAIPL